MGILLKDSLDSEPTIVQTNNGKSLTYCNGLYIRNIAPRTQQYLAEFSLQSYRV